MFPEAVLQPDVFRDDKGNADQSYLKYFCLAFDLCED